MRGNKGAKKSLTGATLEAQIGDEGHQKVSGQVSWIQQPYRTAQQNNSAQPHEKVSDCQAMEITIPGKIVVNFVALLFDVF